MKYKLLDSVVLTRDLPEHALRSGDLGAIVHVHEPDWLEVEFVNTTGDTLAVIPLRESDLRPAEKSDRLPMRRARRSA